MNRDQQKGRDQNQQSKDPSQQNKDPSDNRDKSSQDQMPKQSETTRRPQEKDDEAREPVGTTSTNQPGADQQRSKQQR